MQNFPIDKVGWHTQRVGNTEPREKVLLRFFSVVDFLQRNQLTVRPLLVSIDEITDDFTLHSSDLTNEGLQLVKACYDKWLRKVDKGFDPTNTSMFDATLKKMRGQ